MRVVSGTARGCKLQPVPGMNTRPTTDRVKENVFNLIQDHVRGAEVLDLFAGTGQLGIEALSQGAKKAVFVDAREEACGLIRENLKKTRLEDNASVIRCDYLEYLSRCRETFDIIFLDPPYAEVFLENALNRITEIDILRSGGIIVTERPLEKELSQVFHGYSRSKDYKYGKTLLTIYRKEEAQGQI